MARALSGGFASAWAARRWCRNPVNICGLLVAVLGISWILSVFDMFSLGMPWIAMRLFLIMGSLLDRQPTLKSTATRRPHVGQVPGLGFRGRSAFALLGNPKAVNCFYIGVLRAS